MAEILLSLTIIGVVAAITLPSLTGNINERTWNTQRKALYARFSQAIALMPALNGYGILTAGDSSTSAVDTAAETFVTDGLAKVLKINNICDNKHLDDCGIPSKISPIDGGSAINLSEITTLVGLNPMFNGSTSVGEDNYTYSDTKDTKAAAFETANGESILTYYNPTCIADIAKRGDYSQRYMCANFIYDLNGNKGPNTMGKDIGFISVLYPTDSVVVAPMPLSKDTSSNVNWLNAASACRKMDAESRMPNIQELSAIFYNKKFLGQFNVYHWASSLVASSPDRAWGMTMTAGCYDNHSKTQGRYIRCVKR